LELFVIVFFTIWPMELAQINIKKIVDNHCGMERVIDSDLKLEYMGHCKKHLPIWAQMAIVLEYCGTFGIIF